MIDILIEIDTQIEIKIGILIEIKIDTLIEIKTDTLIGIEIVIQVMVATGIRIGTLIVTQGAIIIDQATIVTLVILVVAIMIEGPTPNALTQVQTTKIHGTTEEETIIKMAFTGGRVVLTHHTEEGSIILRRIWLLPQHLPVLKQARIAKLQALPNPTK